MAAWPPWRAGPVGAVRPARAAVWLDLPAARIASLRAHLDDHLSDPRHARGIRHEHTATAAIAAAALLSAHRLPAGMAAYAAGLSQQALAVFGARWSVRSGSYVAPSESSFRRFLHGVPPGALGAAVGSWLTGQAAAGALDARCARRLTVRLAATAVR